jgi:sugar/nucleoside kinase (ribokinase family)
VLKKIDILFLNEEEASKATGVDCKNEKKIFKKLDKLVSGICVMTKGKEGVIASDGKKIYKAKSLRVKDVDITGAGDSFSAAFVSEIIKQKGIESAMQLGIANAAANIKKMGAKEGIISKDESFVRTKIFYKDIL